MKHLLEVPIYSCLLFSANSFFFVRGKLLSLLWAYIGFTALTTHLLYSLRKTYVLWFKASFIQGLCQSFQSLPFVKSKYVREGYMWKQQSHVSFASRNIFQPCKLNISRFQTPSPTVHLAVTQLFHNLLCLNRLIEELTCNIKLHSFIRKTCSLSIIHITFCLFGKDFQKNYCGVLLNLFVAFCNLLIVHLVH